MTLILPDHLKGKYRPLASTSTQQLIAELQHRQLLAEMVAQIPMPDLQETVARDAMRLQQFSAMFAQMGQAIGQSPFPFTAVGTQPDVLNPAKMIEILVAKVLVVKHPLAPGPVIEGSATPVNDPVPIPEGGA